MDVFDVQVHALVLCHTLLPDLIKLLPQHSLALSLLLSTASIQALAVDLLACQGVTCLVGTISILEVDKAKATRLALLILQQPGRQMTSGSCEEVVWCYQETV